MARRSILYEQENEFAQRNTFLYFVLGLIAVATRLLAQLQAQAAPQEDDEGTAGAAPADSTLDEVSLRDLLR